MNVVRSMLARDGVPGWQSPWKPKDVVPLIVISEGNNEVDARDTRIPQTPIPRERDKKDPFPPLPPKGTLGQSYLVRPRAPVASRSTGGKSGDGDKRSRPPWRPKQTFAPSAKMRGPRQQQATGKKDSGTGKRTGHFKHGVWVARNKGQKRRQWSPPPQKKCLEEPK